MAFLTVLPISWPKQMHLPKKRNLPNLSPSNVSMTEISLAWLLTKVTSPIVGATKLHHIDGAVKAADLILTPEEIDYLEEPYVPHKLVGVMAQNTPAAAKQQHVWSVGNQKIETSK